MSLIGQTSPSYTASFVLLGTNALGIGSTSGTGSDYFYGASGVGYDVTIGAGDTIYNYVDNTAATSPFGAGPPPASTSSNTPEGEVVAIDYGTISNAGVLNTYPLPPTGGANDYGLKTTDVIYIASVGTVFNTGTVGDLLTINDPTNSGTPPYALAQNDYDGILANGGEIVNGAGGLIDGYNGIASQGSGTIDNSGTVDGGNDGILTTWQVTNETGGDISTTTLGYAALHTYSDFINAGYVIGEGFGVLADGSNAVIADYAGAAVPGVTNFDGSQIFNGEISALVRNSETAVLTGNFTSFDAVNMRGTDSSLVLHDGVVGGTYYLPVIVGPMEGGFNGTVSVSNTLVFAFGGLDAADAATLSADIVASRTSGDNGPYYAGSASVDGYYYQWEDFAAVELACFAGGTRIATPAGEVPVEALRAGDRVRVAGPRPGVASVRWIGRRRVIPARHPRPEDLHPVRIARGAFAPGVPSRALWLSPDHAVFADGVLIPVKHLLNGRSIAQRTVREIEYWHVELDRHDVLLAEGLPAESYLDTGNRAAFEGGAALMLHPSFAARSWAAACADLVQEGPRLVAVKQRLFARAGITPSSDPPDLVVKAGDDRLMLRGGAGAWRCAVPAGRRRLRLRSSTRVPAFDTAASLDRRRLGVRVFAIAVDGRPLALVDPALRRGFHAAEQTAEGVCRWTDGDALLALPRGAREVAFRIDGHAVIPAAAGGISLRR